MFTCPPGTHINWRNWGESVTLGPELMRFPLAGILSLLLPALAAAAEPLEQARALVGDLNYKAAAKALDKAEQVQGYTPDQVHLLLELQGVVAGTLNDDRGAKEAFTRLLNLDPGYRLTGKYPPRVTTPFYEAKGWVTDHGALTVEKGEPQLKGARIVGVQFTVKGDVLKRVVAVMVHLREDGGAWTTQRLPAEGGAVTTSAGKVEAWVEVLGAKQWTLKLEGAAASPLVFEGQSPPPPPPNTSLVPEGTHETPAAVATPKAEPVPRFRPVSIALMATGAVSVGVATAFALMSTAGRQRFASATTDLAGNVNGMTRQQALDLDVQVRTQALVADILFGAGGLLAATGVTLFIIGTVSPAEGGGGGFVIGGTLP